MDCELQPTPRFNCKKRTPTAMKPGGVYCELYVLKKLLFCFVDSGLDVPIRIIKFFGQLFVSPAIEQAAFQDSSVCFIEDP